MESAVQHVGKDAFDAARGKWLGHPLHPALTDLPVGAFTTASILDIVGQDEAAKAAIAVGLIAAAPTALAGWADWYSEEDIRVKRAGVIHALSNTTGLVLYGASLATRKGKSRYVGKTLGWLGLLALTAGAYLGGHMVYNLGAGNTHKASMR